MFALTMFALNYCEKITEECPLLLKCSLLEEKNVCKREKKNKKMFTWKENTKSKYYSTFYWGKLPMSFIHSRERSEMIKKNFTRDKSARSCYWEVFFINTFCSRKRHFCHPKNWLRNSPSCQIFRNIENINIFPALKIKPFLQENCALLYRKFCY